MPPDRHPVLDRIDVDAPDFRRRMAGDDGGEARDLELQIWLPVRLDNGGWVAAVRIEGVAMPPIAAMPGEDPLGALIAALAFARDVVDQGAGRVLFGDREAGGLPVFLDRGFRPAVLADVEAQAGRLADDVAAGAWPHSPDPQQDKRTWQIVLTGDGVPHITRAAMLDMDRLLDLDPAISHLEIEIGDKSVHVARDWPSDRFEDADRLIHHIAGSGITAVTVHDRTGKPPRRVEGHGRSAPTDRERPMSRPVGDD